MTGRLKSASKANSAVAWKTVQVGSVNVCVRVPTKIEQKTRVNESKAISGRLSKAIQNPGVRLSMKATTPIYAADTKDPNLVVRKVGNKVSRGVFKDGVFVKVA